MGTKQQKSDAAGGQQVIEYMDRLQHPLKKEIEEVRQVILNAGVLLSEQIKWNAPSYSYNNEDRITFQLHGKKGFRLIFHCGAKVKKDTAMERLIDDPSGLLQWASNDRAIISFTDSDDVNAKKDKLPSLILKWIEAAT